MPSRPVSGVLDPGGHPSSASRCRSGSRVPRISASSAGVGGRVCSHAGRDHQREPSGLRDLVHGHPRVHGPQAHLALGGGEVQHGQVRDHDPHLVEPGRPQAERRRPVVAHPADHVHRLGEHPAGVPRDPVAGRVVDRVARRAAHAEQLGLGPGPVADAGDVLVAEPVNLRGAHHHVPVPAGHHREHRPVRQPALDNVAARRQKVRLPVGQQKVRREREPRQPGPERRDEPHRAGQDRAVPAPRLRARNHADLGPASAQRS